MSGEFYPMKYITFLFLISCSFFDHSNEKKINFWDILEGYQASWDGAKIVSLLGSPTETAATPDSNQESWRYYSSETKFQSWAFSLSRDKKVIAVAYFPTSSGKSLYIMDVEKRWASKKCEHKKATVLTAGHHYTEERNLICEGGRIRVPYNRYNEVEGIYLR
jgi:hypothetical protein